MLAVILSLFLLFPSTKAENVITTGTTLKVLVGTTMVSIDNLVIKSGATLNNSGTFILKKNLTNENASPNNVGSGTVELSGTVSQNITG